jgi:hypothetical protein
MNQIIPKIIDKSGKCLFVWYLYQTYKYIWGGGLFSGIKLIPSMFQNDLTALGIYGIFQIPLATLGALILIPLISRGNFWGLIVGIAYWIMGNLINPFWFIIPDNMQISPDGKATLLLHIANFTWSILALIILTSFYFLRKKLNESHNQPINADGKNVCGLAV